MTAQGALASRRRFVELADDLEAAEHAEHAIELAAPG
jgi:hypothetical protein